MDGRDRRRKHAFLADCRASPLYHYLYTGLGIGFAFQEAQLVLLGVALAHQLNQVPEIRDGGQDRVQNLSLLHLELDDVFFDLVSPRLRGFDESIGGELGFLQKHLGLLFCVILQLFRRALSGHERILQNLLALMVLRQE